MILPKILFISQFSQPYIREYLDLKKYHFRKWVYSLRKKETYIYQDYAVWVADYLQEFEKHPEYEIHFLGPHYGMKKDIQSFLINKVHYHFFKSNRCYLYEILNSKYHFEVRNNFQSNRKKIKGIIDSIKPDLIILCGAENPNYGWAVVDIKNTPVYVILQTLLNDPKRIELKVGSPYRRSVEQEIFRHANYYSTAGPKETQIIKSINPNAVFLPVRFPTHKPNVEIPEKKDYDFVFFSRNVTPFKGIEETLYAFAAVKRSHKSVRINIIGAVDNQYLPKLNEICNQMDITENVFFSGYYPLLEDAYRNVVKAKIAVLPGITSSLNSTIRESMLLGMPVICFESDATSKINEEKKCLLTAKYGEVEDLSRIMLYTLENGDKTMEIAANGKEYANQNFGIENIVDLLLNNSRLIIENSKSFD